MTFILHSTTTLSWFFRDAQTDAGREVLQRVAKTGAHVPQIWRLEVANGLQTALQHKRVESWYRDACLADLSALAIAPDLGTHEAAFNETLRLATRFNLSLYAASYLELSQRRMLPLATLDENMRSAAEALEIELIGT